MFDIDMGLLDLRRSCGYFVLIDRVNDLVSGKYIKRIKPKGNVKGNVKFYYSITKQGIALLDHFSTTLEEICAGK